MNRYQRRLPHWDAVGARLFVTFRLHGSLPRSRVFPPARLTAGQTFVAMDKLLDAAQSGPVFLRHPEIAPLIMDAILAGEKRFQRYHLHSFVVMPNHVHLLVTSTVPMCQWLQALKSFTAHHANRILCRKGAFWQDESYDHLIRSDEEFANVKRYIEWNPVKAGLAFAPEEFLWSSAPGGSPAAGPEA